ncbi:MAG: hypothetical protein COC04_05305 [Gammaproteobacteria bacterium]|nr:MAG: hypothetical protein COC04_05305 [Gammaproteobacteria bacterium]
MAEFTTLRPDLYNKAHLAAGGITAADRHGKAMFYPFLSLSIGAVKLHDFDTINNEIDLAEVASRAKSAAKKQSGNSLFQLTQ